MAIGGQYCTGVGGEVRDPLFATAPALTDTEETDFHPNDFVGGWAYHIPAHRTEVVRPAQYLAFLAERVSAGVANPWRVRKPAG